MKRETLVNVGIVVLALALVGLLACEMMFPLSGTKWMHMLMDKIG